MITVHVKPLSANRAWQGRRFKTPEYEEYERELGYLLPKSIGTIPKNIELHYVVGMSNKKADMANIEKQTTDILSKIYNFNDNKVYRLVMERVDVKKGEEFLSFELTEANPFMPRLDSIASGVLQ